MISLKSLTLDAVLSGVILPGLKIKIPQLLAVYSWVDSRSISNTSCTTYMSPNMVVTVYGKDNASTVLESLRCYFELLTCKGKHGLFICLRTYDACKKV